MFLLLWWHPWSAATNGAGKEQRANPTEEKRPSEAGPKTVVPANPNPSGAQTPASNSANKKKIDDLLQDGEAFIRLREGGRARAKFEEVLRLDPNNTTARSKLNSLK